MASKNDMVIAHIESLKIGTKVSVRGLSAALGVSEGTVYKAIKAAEARGLVMTRPKTGTFRIDSAVSVPAHETTIAHISKVLGLTILAGAQHADCTIRRILVCDGDQKSLQENLDGESETGGVLCVVGNRPNLQELIIRTGAHLLTTGGSRPGESIVISAEQSGICVLTSLQNTYSLLRLLDNHLFPNSVAGEADLAGDWMQAPYHLYYNDIAADWQRLYRSIPSIVSQYPVVNDDLEICGALDIAKAFAANPSQKVSGTLTASTDYLQIPQSVSMQDLAERMVLTGKNIAAVIQDGKMFGLITATDILRYFLFSGHNGLRYRYESFLEAVEEDSSPEQKVFKIHFPEDELENFSEFSVFIMLAAAKGHAESLFKGPCRLDSGTFFSTNSDVSKDNLMLSSMISKCDEKYCALEVEMHDMIQSYTKSILMFCSV